MKEVLSKYGVVLEEGALKELELVYKEYFTNVSYSGSVTARSAQLHPLKEKKEKKEKKEVEKYMLLPYSGVIE